MNTAEELDIITRMRGEVMSRKDSERVPDDVEATEKKKEA